MEGWERGGCNGWCLFLGTDNLAPLEFTARFDLSALHAANELVRGGTPGNTFGEFVGSGGWGDHTHR